MTTTTPTPCSYGSLQYHPGSTKLVLLNNNGYPNTTQLGLSTWTWNGTDWSLANVSNPIARSEYSTAYDGTNLILFGGRGAPSTGLKNDTWSWNGTVWTQLIADDGYNNGLYARVSPYVAQTSGGLVLFGGKDLVFYNEDTWTWNGTAWSLASPANSPSARVGGAFASNGTNKAVLFGGANGSFGLNDTWVWNNTTWSQITTTTQPSIRTAAAMCYYSVGNYLLLFGGISGSSGNLLSDTWKFDMTSNTWTQFTPTNSPAARAGAMMAYDTSSSQIILFGGENNSNILSDTWKWDTTANNWVQL